MYEKSKTNTAAILADRQTVTINVVKTLVRDEPGAIHFENQDIVDHPYLAALHKLHPPLVA